MENVLKIGLFFDGTGENGYNSELNLQLNDAKKKTTISNIYRLFKIYKGQAYIVEKSLNRKWYRKVKKYQSNAYNLCQNNTSQTENYYKIYIEGIGTEPNQKDSGASQAADKGALSGIDKLKKVCLAIQHILEKQHNAQITSINFDIFGFSRGAALARHISNWLLEDIVDVDRSKIKINFLGIFDTVVSSITPYKTKVNTAKIKNIVHFCAVHEWRLFFPLLTVTDKEDATNIVQRNNENTILEVFLPGCHSDIGGAYGAFGKENYLLYLNKMDDNQYEDLKWFLSPNDNTSKSQLFKLNRENIDNALCLRYGQYMLDIYRAANPQNNGFNADNIDNVKSDDALNTYWKACKNAFIQENSTDFSSTYNAALSSQYANSIHNSLGYNPLKDTIVYSQQRNAHELPPLIFENAKNMQFQQENIGLIYTPKANKEQPKSNLYASTKIENKDNKQMEKLKLFLLILQYVYQFLNWLKDLIPNQVRIAQVDEKTQWNRKIYSNNNYLQVRIDIEEAAKHKAQQLLDMFKPKQMPQNIIAQEDTLMNNTKNIAAPTSSVEKEAQKIH